MTNDLDEMEQEMVGLLQSNFELDEEREGKALEAFHVALGAGPPPPAPEIDLPPDFGSPVLENAATLQAATLQTATSGATTTGASLLTIGPIKTLLASIALGGAVSAGVATMNRNEVSAPSASDTPVSRQDPEPKEHPTAAPQEEAIAVPETKDPLSGTRPASAQNDAPFARKSEKETERTSSAEEPAPGNSLETEVHSLRLAQGALQRGDAETALSLVASLNETHPSGALLPERRMTELLARCALGHRERAIALASSIRASDAGPLYATRVDASCVGLRIDPEETLGAPAEAPQSR